MTDTAVDIPAAVSAACQGDALAFDALVRAFADRLLRFLMAGGLRHSDAEDVVQETFIRAYHNLERYDSRYAFSTWLFTIAHRLRCNHHRRQRRYVTMGENQDLRTAPETEHHEIGALWAKARELLPERQYQALWLRFGEDLELDEVAEVLGVSSGNARVLVHRARSKLAERLDPDTMTEHREDAP
ncbi:MAG: RNA polymerase sigma factor [Planctomycetota bacterium]|nr:RNA polymerase sigma factor [Planctomycetota bacterium]